MYLTAKTFDDLLRKVIKAIIKHGARMSATRGDARELFGVLLEVERPRSRLSRTERKGTLFSALGELLWYLAGTNALDFISYYAPRYGRDSEDGKTIRGAYGPRLFDWRKNNQIAQVIELLRDKPTSRRAVIAIFEAGDIATHFRETPCTCTLQIVVRDGRLHMLANMRSNDVFVGLPHDVFAFTMLQEILARTLGLKLGTYRHAVGSLHLYDDRMDEARTFLREGWQERVSMPPMPKSDPWPAIEALRRIEPQVRSGEGLNADDLDLEPYWKDLVRLLQVYSCFRRGKKDEISVIRQHMISKVYDPYIEKKLNSEPRSAAQSDVQ
jgi:thymidylate synthase